MACAETSLVVQWLRLRASTAGGMGLIPGRGHAAQPEEKKKKMVCAMMYSGRQREKSPMF